MLERMLLATLSFWPVSEAQVLAKLKCETTLQSASCSLETTCLVGRFTCMGIVGLKRKELAPADHTVVEKQFTK